MKSVDIIMPTHGRLDMTLAAVEALYENTQTDFHLIVVDDSTDLTPEYFKWLQNEHKNITFVHSDEPYKSGNQIFNIGLKHGDSPYAATIMNSVRVEPDWEGTALQLMDDNSDIGAIGFKCLFPSGLIESAGIALMNYVPIDLGRDEPGHRLSVIYECQAVQWAFALLRKEALNLSEGNYRLDESSYNGFRGWDDIDNCFVLRKNGWKIFYCGLGAGYHTPRTTRGDKNATNYENSIIFYKRWGLWEEVRKNARAQWDIAQKLNRVKWQDVKDIK